MRALLQMAREAGGQRSRDTTGGQGKRSLEGCRPLRPSGSTKAPGTVEGGEGPRLTTAASGERPTLTLGTLTATSIIKPATMARHILIRMEQCSKRLRGRLPVAS